jgi:DNA-binding MarR family transcriptional regulator
MANHPHRPTPHQPISITLSPAQIDEIVRTATQRRSPSVSTLLGSYTPIDTKDPRMSRSLMRGLAILSSFGPDNSARGILELARDLGMSPSTTHRYAFTLVELGLLERCPHTRKYRLPSVANPPGQ